MRLSSLDLQRIKSVYQDFSLQNSKLFLFGSRLDDSKKGGDIDLLLVFENADSLAQFKRLEFLVQLKKAIGDRKIDLTLATANELKTDPFLMIIMDSAVEL